MKENGRRKSGRVVLKVWIVLFLLAEAALFAIIIRNEFENLYLAPVRYASVLLCGLTAMLLLFFERRVESVFLFIAMLFTAGADWFLVVKDESYETALILFFCAQAFHFVRLSIVRGKRFFWSLIVRVLVSGLFVGAVYYLDAEDPIVLLGGVYFTELIMNTVDSGILIRRDRRFVMAMVGFILFILCDISVGMNGMRDEWGLSTEVSNLCADMIWVWYLPSQVLIVLSNVKKPVEEGDFVLVEEIRL